MEEKICVFKDMYEWLNNHNQTLRGVFEDKNDNIAWNIASYTNNDDEYHYD